MLRAERGNGTPLDSTPKLSQIGAFLVVVATPLVFFPISFSPFVDPKLPVLIVGTSLLWRMRTPVDRSLARASLALIFIIAAASLLGVDRWYSLMGIERQSTGFVLLSVCALLLVLGSSISYPERKRINKWIVVTSLIVAFVATAARLLPAGWAQIPPGLIITGSTLGQRVIVDAVVAAGIAASLGSMFRPLPLAGIVFVLSSALGSGGGRLGWVAALTGMGIVCLRRPDRRGQVLAASLAAIVMAFALWAALAALALPQDIQSPATPFGQLGEGSAKSRVFIYSGAIRAGLRRPVLGWGPGNTSGAWLSSATSRETAFVPQRVGDAHNLLLEFLVSTGLIGLAAVCVLIYVVFRATRAGPQEMAWAAGAAGALFVYHLFQPMNVAATPLMFFFAGMSASRAPLHVRPAKHSAAITRLADAVLLIAFLLATVRVAASIFEKVGRTYFSPWALEQSLRLEPQRATAARALALSLALDGRGGDHQAAARARELAAKTVTQHPWHTEARITAANVETLLRNDLGRATWAKFHLRRFPNDRVTGQEISSM